MILGEHRDHLEDHPSLQWLVQVYPLKTEQLLSGVGCFRGGYHFHLQALQEQLLISKKKNRNGVRKEKIKQIS